MALVNDKSNKKVGGSSEKRDYVLERASKMLWASTVTPTPILSASITACLQFTPNPTKHTHVYIEIDRYITLTLLLL